MKMLEWVHVVFGLLAIGFGAVVLRGVLLVKLSGKWALRFLECSLIASLAGLLPLSHRLSPVQAVCMLSVYCSGAVVVAWLRFDLAGIWRPVFAFLATALLYLNVVSVSTGLFGHSLLLAMAAPESSSCFAFAKFFLASVFAVLGILAVRMCHVQRTH
jgi:hypothetical protein